MAIHLAEMERSAKGEVISNFVQAWDVPLRRSAVGSLKEELRSTFAIPGSDERAPLEEDAADQLVRFAILLVLADDLAGDYRDPRLPVAAPA
ncbi:MAG TPA: hypothetical protein VK988_11275 [Acidimicrobiales bacterium]|nr:hypothetical protein [Acidimicrobiales bacterium]